jgi:hypothetical protein
LCEKAALLYSINYNNINDMADQEEVQTEQVEQQNGEEFSEAAAEPMEGQETGGGDAQLQISDEDEDDR